MSVNFLGLFNDSTNLIIMTILILGIIRAVQMHGAFVNPAYRSRATWSGFFMLTILANFATGYIPIPSFDLAPLIGVLGFFVLLFMIFAYADRSILVAIETDFFHRDTLGWLRARWPVAFVFVASLSMAFLIGNPPAGAPFWQFVVGDVLWWVATGVVLSYLTGALIIGARRSSDKALRRSILLLGLALSTLVVSLVATSPFNQGTLFYVIINQGTGLVGIYLIYRSVMSLSPLGRIPKEVNAATQ